MRSGFFLRQRLAARYPVSVRFREAATGPVLVGIGRHYGLEMFAGPAVNTFSPRTQ